MCNIPFLKPNGAAAATTQFIELLLKVQLAVGFVRFINVKWIVLIFIKDMFVCLKQT